MSFPSVHFDPVDCNDVAAKMAAGTLVHHKGQLFRYVQAKDAVTYVAGHAVSYDNQDAWAITNDFSSMEATTARAAGVVVRVMTTAYWGFMLIQGLYLTVAKVPGVDTWTADDLCELSSTDGAVKLFAFVGTTAAATTAQLLVFAKRVNGVLGTAAGASNDTTDTVPVLVRCA